MTLVDIVVFAIIGISVLLGVIRGLVRELLSLAGWVVAFAAANFAGPVVARLLPQSLGSEEIRLLAAFVLVFVAALVAMSLVTLLVSNLVKSAGFGVPDRVLGGAFGLARGALVVMVLVLLAGLTPLPAQAAWRNALLRGGLEAAAGQVKEWLPEDLSKRIKY